MTLKKIPKMAMPIVEILRRDVKKPKRLPVSIYYIRSCAAQKILRWETPREQNKKICCPMGLHSESCSEIPYSVSEFLPHELTIKKRHIKSFADWWDNVHQDNAQEAIDMIWPDK
jgi:hypothetical protein